MARRRGRRSPAQVWSFAGLAVAVGIAVGLHFGLDLPLYLSWLSGSSVALFGLYGIDKRRARSGGGRVPEVVLHAFALAGGVAGGWAGMWTFRHKTRHMAFKFILAVATILHAGAILWAYA